MTAAATLAARDFLRPADQPAAGRWPGGARIAVSFVLNFEEGAELSIADGDERNEPVYEVREEVFGAPDPCMNSHYEYGPRAGFDRILSLLEAHDVRATISTCARAAERVPSLIAGAAERDHEIACHGYRWESHSGMEAAEEARVIARTYDSLTRIAGRAPVGWHTRSASSVHTRRLLREHGGFLYDSDAYNDDLPYVLSGQGAPHVVLPYSFDTNDMRFSPGGGFVFADDFTRYCADAFDWLWREGAERPRMMSVGLHQRIIGRPGRIAGLEKLLKHMRSRGDVWFATRAEIAHEWRSVAGLPRWTAAA
ncbi:Peptidoglycan/xylan/chitin deacetylase, PgdA/CDA1 family [Pseudooceanicola antarcticus]|uniref:Chitooligosaccharide deacetylase n=1 Tax=Pseudooceanicola antarcticus TaxID=1247613 RepID=A0A285JEW8_9RHOB|nr:polysaccharide deacetylase family protein [Pseudooceanicola antarcticus]PJE31084.1 chitin deacetylase [Pseudooceanicola antarcticus]SNY58623.1 Peptidoglycan/xylan/chitin deacetylase, PgdA/CDA1 family [Pseudooceanicola antarcticus]